MKKFINILVMCTFAFMLFGCKQSDISASETQEEEFDGIVISRTTEATTPSWTFPESSAYVIPENAETGENGGPGAMSTTAVDYSYYPESKRPKTDPAAADTDNTLIIYYYPDGDKIVSEFDLVEECDAQSVITMLMKDRVLSEETVLNDFTVDGDKAELSLEELTPAHSKVDKTLLAKALANTFIDNFNLSEIHIYDSSEDYGTLTFTK